MQPNKKCQKKTSDSINVLVIGRSQVGKSTLIHVLANPHYEGSLATGMAETKECYSHKVLLTTNEDEYTVNIVDTPGLQEVRHDTEESRSNTQIQNLIATFLKHNIQTLNAVCFVSVAGKTHQNDMVIFNSLIDFLGPTYSSISMLILTHCDGFPNSRLDEFKEKLTSSEYDECKKVINYCKLGLYYHGAINRDELETHNDANIRVRILNTKLEHIKPMREALAQKLIDCANCSKPVDDLLTNLCSSHNNDHTRKKLTRNCQLI
ncbi:unnamed protein product [Rotaria socialis]|uniref:AIG1-type G domain-containing protein n=1 Tax=Rotaria socialis TaxID=392032 RepID=A0A819ZY94_9BILA|nr:unnamed protein product [Rotaria socialis]CAF3370338.1 unnamed protein product [Rotaria socialis]CAF3521204.1 unnamed protein product [Rotaria socialis]CAF4177551.1 unnamed protein product [Rotaria socialis]CAF4312394.1 unnamed protein product [Rotaria socialis]